MRYRLRIIVGGGVYDFEAPDLTNDIEAAATAQNIVEHIRKASANDWLDLGDAAWIRADAIQGVIVEEAPAVLDTVRDHGLGG